MNDFMSEVTEKIKQELLKRCEEYNKKYDYDFWNDHIKYVVSNSINLAKKYNADYYMIFQCRQNMEKEKNIIYMEQK